MDDQRILNKLDKIEERQQIHTEQLIHYNVILQEHIRRTELLEKSVEIIDMQLRPIEEHVSLVNKMFKGFAIIVSAMSAIATIIKLMFRKV